MKNSKTRFSRIRPGMVEEGEGVRAWFTLKNEWYESGSRQIRGLNLGFNTPESKDVVERNRSALIDDLQLDEEWIAYAEQVHSNRIRVVSRGGTYPSTDGLITRVPGLTLAIQVADCAAVLLWDSTNSIVGALHAGWRGAAGDIVPHGIEKMMGLGSDPRKMKAFVSPCISLKNFEVGPEVADQFPGEFVDYEHYSKPHIDLKEFLNHQLLEAGIPQTGIEIREECTIDGQSDFYSYRREGEQSGRMMALIQIAENKN